MKYQKYAIAIVVIALFYLGVSYLLSIFFGREFHLGSRIAIAFGFGVLITLVQVLISKKKRR